MGWNGPELLGDKVEPWKPSAVSWRANRLDVFGVGAGGKLQHWWFDANASPQQVDFAGQQESLGGGQLDPTILSAVSKSGRLDVFGSGAVPTLKHWWFDANASPQQADFAGQQESLGGQFQLLFGVSAVSWEVGRLDVFAIGNEGIGNNEVSNLMLQHWWFDANASPEQVDFAGQRESLGVANLNGHYDTSVVSWEANRLDLFADGSSSEILYWWYDNDAGNLHASPESLTPGQFGHIGGFCGMSAVSWGVGRLDVFGPGADGKLLHWWYS